jgi:hypothetical protein
MNPGNYREALIEVNADESEGADILMVSHLLLQRSRLSYAMRLFYSKQRRLHVP